MASVSSSLAQILTHRKPSSLLPPQHSYISYKFKPLSFSSFKTLSICSNTPLNSSLLLEFPPKYRQDRIAFSSSSFTSSTSSLLVVSSAATAQAQLHEESDEDEEPISPGKREEMADKAAGGDGQENMAAWLTSANTIKIQPFKLPPLGPLDVKVRVKAVGICGSDVHYYKHMRIGDYVVKEPMVIGHECAGIIEEIGTDVKTLSVGDRVALEPGISCARCPTCKIGTYNLCPDMKFFSTPPIHGSLANQVVHPADLCFKLPENVSLEDGAMCEPISVSVYSCRRTNVGVGTKVLIMGAGPIGIITMLVAKAFGAHTVVIVDVDPSRLSVAKELGADETIQVTSNIEDVDSEVAQVLKAVGGSVDVTFDCAGFGKTMTTALKATKSGGKVCVVGMGQAEIRVPLIPAASRGVDIVGIFRYNNTWPLCLELLSTGKLDVKRLITHRFNFTQSDVEKAFETSARGGSAIKVMFNL